MHLQESTVTVQLDKQLNYRFKNSTYIFDKKTEMCKSVYKKAYATCQYFATEKK